MLPAGASPPLRMPALTHTVLVHHREPPMMLRTKGIGAMTHCRHCGRFRTVRLAGCGAWLLDCGHTYLPLPDEGQRSAAYSRLTVTSPDLRP